jgi:hypothetical protein
LRSAGKSSPLQAETKLTPMTNKLFALVILFAGILSSCDSGLKEKARDTSHDTILVTVLTFTGQADSLANRHVIIEGTVLHTCKHGGKRMFLVDGSDSIRVEITTGGDIAKFDEALIGSRVRVWGILKEERVDEKYLNEWENEVKNPTESHETGLHSGAQGHENQDAKDKLDNIASLRADLKASGKDHLSFFSIEAWKYTELK